MRLRVDVQQVPAHVHDLPQVREHGGDELAGRTCLLGGGQLLGRAAATASEDHRASCQVTSRAPTQAIIGANTAAPSRWPKTTSSGSPVKYWM